MTDSIYLQTKAVIEELGEKAKLVPGNIVVVGCSTSEVCGSRIGSDSVPEAAEAIADGHKVEADLDNGIITDLTTGEKFETKPFPEFIQNIIKKGGLLVSIDK